MADEIDPLTKAADSILTNHEIKKALYAQSASISALVVFFREKNLLTEADVKRINEIRDAILAQIWANEREAKGRIIRPT